MLLFHFLHLLLLLVDFFGGLGEGGIFSFFHLLINDWCFVCVPIFFWYLQATSSCQDWICKIKGSSWRKEDQEKELVFIWMVCTNFRDSAYSHHLKLVFVFTCCGLNFTSIFWPRWSAFFRSICLYTCRFTVAKFFQAYRHRRNLFRWCFWGATAYRRKID